MPMKKLLEAAILVLFFVSTTLLCIDTAQPEAARDSLKTSINFPDSLDDWTTEEGGDPVDAVDRWWWNDIIMLRDAIESLEVWVGVENSEVTTTIDYRLSALEGTVPTVTTVDSAVVSGSTWVVIGDIDSATIADSSTYADTADYATAWAGSSAVYDSLSARADSLTAHRTQIDLNVDSLTAHTADVVALWDSINSVGGATDTARYGDDPVFDVVDSLAVGDAALFNDFIWGGYDNSANYYRCFPWEGCDGDTTAFGSNIIYFKSPVYFDSVVVYNAAAGGIHATGALPIGMDEKGFSVNSEAYWDTAGILHLGAADSIKFGDGVAFTRDGSQIVASHKVKFPGGHLGGGDSTLQITVSNTSTEPGVRAIWAAVNGNYSRGLSVNLTDSIYDGGGDLTGSVGGRGISVSHTCESSDHAGSNPIGISSTINGGAGYKATAGYFIAQNCSLAYAIYASATGRADSLGGSVPYAAYFADGDVKSENDIYCDSLHGIADTALYCKGKIDSCTYSDTAAWVASKIDSATNADTSAYCTGKVDSATYADTALAISGVTRVDSSTYADTGLFVQGDSVTYADTSDYASYAGWSYDGAACDVADSAAHPEDDDWVVTDSITAVDANITGDLYVGDDAAITAELTAADIDISDSLLSVSVTASGVIHAEQLTSSDDATITDDLSAADVYVSDTLTAVDAVIDTVAAAIKGNVVGDVTGDVTGALTGRADSASYAYVAGEADSASSGDFYVGDSLKVGDYAVIADSNAWFDSLWVEYIDATVAADSVMYADTSEYAKGADAGSWTWDDGLTETGNEIDIELAPLNPGLEFSSDRLRVDTDDATISRGASGLYVMQNIYDEIGDANTTLDESNANPDCGAALIGVDNTEFDLSSGTNAQDVLDDHDAKIVAYSDSAADFQVTGDLTADSLVSNITMTNDLDVEGTVTTDTLIGDIRFTGADTWFNGDISVAQTVFHLGDTDSKITFEGDDRMILYAGNLNFISFGEAASNSKLAINEIGEDIDVRIGASGVDSALFVQGSDGAVYIEGELEVGGDVEADSLKGELKPASGNQYLYRQGMSFGPTGVVGTQKYGDTDAALWAPIDTFLIDQVSLTAYMPAGSDLEIWIYDMDDNIIWQDSLETAGGDFMRADTVAAGLANNTIVPAGGVYIELTGSDAHLRNVFVVLEGYYLNP
jgi:hypothetical protein